MKKLIKFLSFTVMAAMLLSGCSEMKKAQLTSGNDPEKAIMEVSKLRAEALKSQHDVLADEAFTKGTSYLNEAKNYYKQEDATKDVLINASISKYLFKDARKIAKTRKSSANRILNARKSALDAGARKSDLLVESMLEIDDDLKSETGQFSKALSPEDFSALQKQYLVLESKSVQFTELNSVIKTINQALENDADDLAPKTLRTASLDYKTSMNIIAQSPRSPTVFGGSVKKSRNSATLLLDVMNVIKGAKGTPERIALQIVKQKRALGELSTNVGKLEANLQTTKDSLQSSNENLETTKQSLQEKEGTLRSQEEQLARASTQVRFQKAMDEARKVLSQNDALVYQQGNKLIFRLKRINFRTGTSVIPKSSTPLITKVNKIIKKLDAKKVIVQGHTDSVGSAKVNKKLSSKRATSVANYLHSLKGGYKITFAGYGEANPIASNETSAGRATNRRVDLVVSVKE